MNKKIILLILLLLALPVFAFEGKRSHFIASNGTGYPDEAAVWAWLENNNDSGPGTPIYNTIQNWMDNQWRAFGWDLNVVRGVRVLFQYENRIDPGQRGELQGKLDFFLTSLYGFHSGSLNNRFFDFTVRYLYSQGKNIQVQYGPVGADLDHFLGYVPGNTYDSFQIAKDWLFWKFKGLVETGDDELDSEYTKTFIISLYTLYDFAEDAKMKRAAKMMLDFLLLDSVLDVSGELHGSHPGRTYASSILDDGPRIYDWVYWDIGGNPHGNQSGQFYSAYVSDYRLPEMIYDIGKLDDEPDEYWHMNLENNRANFVPSNQGKWNYVTKYYNLGGSKLQWMLNIKSAQENSGGVRLWINGSPTISPGCGFGECYLQIGTGAHQYKDSMLITGGGYLHFANMDSFDLHEQASGWDFYQEGNTAVAIKLNPPHVSALEVAVLGVDYPGFGWFKNAVLSGSDLANWFCFKTRNGDTIAAIDGKTYVGGTCMGGGEPVWDFPFKRIETIDYMGNHIVDFNDNVMTVKKHGLECTYNFNTWTYSGNGCGGPSPDVNCDNIVDVRDFGILLSYWNTDGTGYSSSCSSPDIDESGIVDSFDTSLLVDSWSN